MAKQTVNVGVTPNDGTGDCIRDAFDKVNDNFSEVYGVVGLLKSDGTDTLSAAVPVTDYMPAYDLFNNFYDWGPGVLYEVGDMVYWSNLAAEYFYVCKTAHTSTGTDPTTNDRANWIFIYAIPDLASISDATGILEGKQATMTKATSGDINTGTDDAKYVTSAGIAGSNIAMKSFVIAMAIGLG